MKEILTPWITWILFTLSFYLIKMPFDYIVKQKANSVVIKNTMSILGGHLPRSNDMKTELLFMTSRLATKIGWVLMLITSMSVAFNFFQAAFVK